MDAITILTIILAVLLVSAIAVLFFISRKSQRVMESILTIMTDPERAKIQDATRVLNTIMAVEIDKIGANFKNMSDTLAHQVGRAEDLKTELSDHNEKLVATADEAARKIATMNTRLENSLTGFKGIIDSTEWSDVEKSAAEFQSRINELLSQVDATSQESLTRSATIQTAINGWIESGKILTDGLQNAIDENASHMNSMITEAEALGEKLDTVAKSVADGFATVQTNAADYENVMNANERVLSKQLEKMDAFTKQSKTLLNTQLNGLTNTANVVGGHIRLAESSFEKQDNKMKETIKVLMESAQNTELFVRNISNEMTVLSGKFQGEIKEFAIGVTGELESVSGVATTTLADTKIAAGAFAESVRTMADSVGATITEMNNAHEQLTAQSRQLVETSEQTAAQLQPLSEMVEKYYATLPALSRGSNELSEQLTAEIDAIAAKIAELNNAMEKSVVGIADSSLKLEHLSGQSRQQMIDLMSDYAKAIDTMKALNQNMADARAAAPMRSLAANPAAAKPAIAAISPAEFIAQSGGAMERLHELSMDLTRTVGAEIPEQIWKKYHDGDKAIFSKWFAKMLSATDKKRLKELFKNDAVFRSQATQFVRSFAKMLAGADMTDNRDMVAATLLKTDLGQMYLVLNSYV